MVLEPDGHFTHEGKGMDAKLEGYRGKYGGHPDFRLPL